VMLLIIFNIFLNEADNDLYGLNKQVETKLVLNVCRIRVDFIKRLVMLILDCIRLKICYANIHKICSIKYLQFGDLFCLY